MQDSPTSDKGKQVDQGQREKKDECGLIKEGSPSQAEYTNSSLRKDVSLKKGLSRCDDIIEAEPLSQMQPPRGTSPVTHGKGVFSEHRNPFHNALQMNGYSQQFYIPFPVLTGFPVPGESGYFRFSGMLPAMFEDRTKQSQVMGGEMPSKDEEEFSGKGDPAGGQSEQKQGQDPIDDSTGTGGVFHFGHSNKKKSPASDKIDLGKSKSERSSTKNTLLNQELNASVHPAPPIPNYIHGSQSTCGIFPFFDQGQPPDFYEPLGKSQTPVNPQFINASYFTSLDMQTVWGAVPLAQCGPIPPLYAYNPGIQASFSHRSSVTDEVF